VIQQLTGINAIMFYSGTIFTQGGSISANQATAIIQAVNFLAVIIAAGLLGKYGRRTLMLYATAACTIFIILTGIFANNNFFLGELLTTLIYVAAFEFGPGPVVWMYMSEIMNDKGVSIGTFLNWLFTLIVGLTTSGLFNKFTKKDQPGMPFIIFGVFCGLGTIFVYFFMKETKGLSDA